MPSKWFHGSISRSSTAALETELSGQRLGGLLRPAPGAMPASTVTSRPARKSAAALAITRPVGRQVEIPESARKVHRSGFFHLAVPHQVHDRGVGRPQKISLIGRPAYRPRQEQVCEALPPVRADPRGRGSRARGLETCAASRPRAVSAAGLLSGCWPAAGRDPVRARDRRGPDRGASAPDGAELVVHGGHRGAADRLTSCSCSTATGWATCPWSTRSAAGSGRPAVRPWPASCCWASARARWGIAGIVCLVAGVIVLGLPEPRRDPARGPGGLRPPRPGQRPLRPLTSPAGPRTRGALRGVPRPAPLPPPASVRPAGAARGRPWPVGGRPCSSRPTTLWDKHAVSTLHTPRACCRGYAAFPAMIVGLAPRPAWRDRAGMRLVWRSYRMQPVGGGGFWPRWPTSWC